MTDRKIWVSETDWFSAVSRDEAVRLRNEFNGWCDMEGAEHEQDEPFEDEPMPDDKMLGSTFPDGCTEEGVERAYPTWVDKEPSATIEWLGEGRNRHARVTAPAHIWAKHMVGMVCTTEY